MENDLFLFVFKMKGVQTEIVVAAGSDSGSIVRFQIVAFGKVPRTERISWVIPVPVEFLITSYTVLDI
jgi:hypothetical protein